MLKSWREFSVSVRRRETTFYDLLYRIADSMRNFSFPCIRPFHSLLYYECTVRSAIWHNFWRVVYYEPMFKSQCVSVGPGFRMLYAGNGIAHIFGDLQLHIGANVTIFDNTYLVGLKVNDKPALYIGDNSYIGPAVSMMVGRRVTIGNNCLITSNIITDNQGHSFRDVFSRLEHGGGSPLAEDFQPVHIGDFCFLPLDTVVYPGTNVGDGVVARIGTHLNGDIPPFCMVAGQPWKIVKVLPIPPEIEKIVGNERYETYLSAHRKLDL